MLKTASLTRSGMALVNPVGGRTRCRDRHLPAMILMAHILALTRAATLTVARMSAQAGSLRLLRHADTDGIIRPDVADRKFVRIGGSIGLDTL